MGPIAPPAPTLLGAQTGPVPVEYVDSGSTFLWGWLPQAVLILVSVAFWVVALVVAGFLLRIGWHYGERWLQRRAAGPDGGNEGLPPPR